jgi:hypothetical protein
MRQCPMHDIGETVAVFAWLCKTLNRSFRFTRKWTWNSLRSEAAAASVFNNVNHQILDLRSANNFLSAPGSRSYLFVSIQSGGRVLAFILV